MSFRVRRTWIDIVVFEWMELLKYAVQKERLVPPEFLLRSVPTMDILLLPVEVVGMASKSR